jgi:hypothetical protein
MTKTILMSTVLALLCAGPTTATAALSQNTGVPVAHASRVAHQSFPDMRAAVPETLTMFPVSTTTTLSLQLSRNGRAEPKPKRLRRLGLH